VRPPGDFYEIQKRQRGKTLLLFLALCLFYVFALGLIGLAAAASVSLFIAGSLLAPAFLLRLILFAAAAAVIIALVQFRDARRLGAAFILRRLQAAPPDPSDRYHRQFLDALEEMRIGSGLPRVRSYVLPSFAFNSMALVEADGTPAVAVTEGLLADSARDEIQAVCAHELAHIARGDAFTLTLVCSLADFFERLFDVLTPERADPPAAMPGLSATTRGDLAAPLPVFLTAAVVFSGLVMRLLTAFFSREREFLADAAAVEISRGPAALARALYKAHTRNAFVGDFSLTYNPLFIVPPDPRGASENRFARLFATHPPLMKRLGILTAMAGSTRRRIIEDVEAAAENREEARWILGTAAGPAAGMADSVAEPEEPGRASEARIWRRRAPNGAWGETLSLPELICAPGFSTSGVVQNTQEGIAARAREFPQVRLALRRLADKTPLDPGRSGRCPRCGIPLRDADYEGVPVRACPRCRGRLVDQGLMERIIARREVGFSADLVARAAAFRTGDSAPRSPGKKGGAKAASGKLLCPACGWRLVPRPFSYQDFLPVDKCLSCQKIWFDGDELEILQILIEERLANRRGGAPAIGEPVA
jgi:heat shock protein HtpX